MKKIIYSAVLFLSATAIAQEEPKSDTTRMNMGKVEIIVVDHSKDDFEDLENDTIDAAPDEDEKDNFGGHWAGIDMGFSTLMNDQFSTSFDNYPYWKNDPAKSMTWNLNLFEHKFGNSVGLTTGLGFSFTQVAFRDNYLLTSTPDTLFAVLDSVNTYSKNKLKAAYLTVPLLFDICSVKKGDDGFYLAAGVVGGVRMASKIKRNGEFDGKEFQQKEKGVYGLNSFKVDGMVRMGYGHWGAFASYSLLPLFDTDKTTEIHPLTFGLTLNF
jgi:hypothetical protein